MRTTTCRSCGRKVVFATDENGKTQILDVVAPCYAMTCGPLEMFDGPLTCARSKAAFVSHFATCPNASSHSKKAKEPKLDLGGANI